MQIQVQFLSSQWWKHCMHTFFILIKPGPIFTKQADVLPHDLVKFCSPEIPVKTIFFLNRSEIWQTLRQQLCRDACHILERYDHNKSNVGASILHEIFR